MKKTINSIAAFVTFAIAATLFSLSSCNKKEQTVTPAPPGNEFLTTVILKCINTAAPFDTTTALWRDLTPDDVAILPDTSHAILNFTHSSTYTCAIYILDEHLTATAQLASTTHFNINSIASTTVNVTDEIRARQNYHLVCFDMSGGVLPTNISVVRTDYDTNNPPLQVGLDDKITTLNTTSGRMEVTLHHQPNVKNGSCGPGSADFDVFFATNIN